MDSRGRTADGFGAAFVGRFGAYAVSGSSEAFRLGGGFGSGTFDFFPIVITAIIRSLLGYEYILVCMH